MNTTRWASLRVEVGWQALMPGGPDSTRPDPVYLFGFCVTLRDSSSAGLCRLTSSVPCLFLRPLVSLRDSRRSSLEEHFGAVLRRAR
ncbi:hypothetical protein M9H77_31999 [Catharanthus roseus]|uniref:Uncharacterized protein n=1 Tax=Catharanthus roseus TaxID=4058 RepID=A0ACC0A4B9_CATRO|nr:hypothetical protein M9H77_31999 [Catharanthus roseus]